ncbi:DnaJ-class molecular chaperone with C-terminal Zn finger domain [Cylindrospermum stagnale PCC 7417]|uniref:DnaJ-class molecular chaperone with C-terminal Zn finger domain n=1 Tax=Cylindrospermum stagnale PCC 7417 TaxID=56107 RepID=K9WPV1_9NOST|nr:IMS domain-containing protein [Cylindrospermum stagnale]AFZ22420.1 DnaJ-class molecular chaperone with C-terminal Zn finger domain [Cylindrospermum stagnale PCC 7417]
MRIPLDYYRILGLPLAASEEQLRQAYSDRIVQLPRREYSTAAISSRKQLIEEAFVVLSEPKDRSKYDQLYLAHAYDPDRSAATVATENHTESNHREHDAQSLSIEIAQEELVGALLILQELGEYELVLKLGRPYLVNKNVAVDAKAGNGLASESVLNSAELPDIILTVALACLELGREQWQQGHYENTAISLETGEELLSRYGLFSGVQAEMAADLNKLRPYRILELLALPQEKTAERRQGLELLQNILEDRGGIDGTGNDESGLNVDDFLRFIQQLRNYLTVAEQHKLFEAESKRPSAVATYLAVYALIARGFAQRQPALIRQAKQMLMRLGKRQDVHLEQSLCALLLGQTEEATRVLEMSQEYEALAFIREKSQDSPDLLPGLCLYGEQWLQQEVFPHFRDLTRQQASLKDYFADQQVQAYLEALPTDAETTNEWAVINRQPFPQPQANHPRRRRSNSTGVAQQFNHSSTPDPELPEAAITEKPENSHPSPPRGNASPTATSGSKKPEIPVAQFPTLESLDRGIKHHTNGSKSSAAPIPTQKRRRRKSTQTNIQEQVLERQRYPQRRRTFAQTLEGKTRLVWTVFISLAGILVFWLLVSTTFGWISSLFSPKPSLQGEQLAVQLNQPPIAIPDRNSKPQPPEGALTTATAEEVIQTWLSTKATALGPSHEIDSLEQILAGSALSQWRLIAQQNRVENHYRKYDHSLKVESVDKTESDPNRVAVKATVKEITKFYENGQLKKSSEENLRVRYDLIRREGVWRIQGMSVVNQII